MRKKLKLVREAGKLKRWLEQKICRKKKTDDDDDEKINDIDDVDDDDSNDDDVAVAQLVKISNFQTLLDLPLSLQIREGICKV